MSEGSLPPFKYLDPRRYPARLRDAAGRLLGRLRRGRDESPWNESATSGVAVERPPKSHDDTTRPAAGRGTSLGADSGSASPDVQESGREGIGNADRERAAAALRSFLKENDTNVERAARTNAQAERLEREGIPSDSARNRAERAHGEVVDGLVRLRRSLLSSGEPRVARALDLEAARLDPPIPPGELDR